MGQTPDESFARYRKRVAEIVAELARRHPAGELDEQGVPSYVGGFSLSRLIFWHRLKVVRRLLASGGSRCLDFGCGAGVMLPVLARRFESVHAVDCCPQFAREFLDLWAERHGPLDAEIRVEADLDAAGLTDASIDRILALDVLEHVDDLEGLLARMAGLLKPTGELLVSGPTENWVYKLGRKIVGFSGDYHHRSIHDIRRAMEAHFDVRVVKRICFPFTLFWILSARPK